MKKLLATLTTVAMLATSTVAFADVVVNNDGYKKAAGTYSIASDLSKVEGQLTLLIIPEEAYLSTTGIADEDILYIDQGEYSSTLFKSVGILGGKELEAGNYYAKIGGTGLNGIIVEKFTVAGENEHTRAKGDVVGSTAGEINIDDVVAVVQISISTGTWTEDQLYAADVVGTTDGQINIDDVVAVTQKSVGLSVEFK